MKKTQNKRVIILTDLNSKYFEQAVFYIKSGAVCSEDLLLREANSIVAEFSRRYSPSERPAKKIAAYKLTAAIFLTVVSFVMLFHIFQ